MEREASERRSDFERAVAGAMVDNPRVAIAVPEPLMGTAIQSALEADGITVVGRATDADSAVKLVSSNRPDVALVDVDLSGKGLNAASRILEKTYDTRVLVFAPPNDERAALEALRLGIDGYLRKDVAPERLPFIVRCLMAGEPVLPRNVVRELIDSFRGHHGVTSAQGRKTELTGREYEVLEYLRQGLSTAEIAERLVVSAVTVRTHAAAVMRKLQVPNRDALLTLADHWD